MLFCSSSKINLNVVGEGGDPVLVRVLGRVAGAGVRVRSVGDAAGTGSRGLVGAVGWVLHLGSATILAAGAGRKWNFFSDQNFSRN